MDAKPKPPLHAKSKPSLHEWLSERKGIAHAHEALRAGYSRYQLRVALAVWDSALNSKRVSEEQLTQLPLRSAAARAVRAASTCFSDSGIETLPVTRLAFIGITVQQRVELCGHNVDGLIGERLVLQIDGFAHHSSPEQRRIDIAHDRALRLRGYTVLRLDYKQIMFEWPQVQAEILLALAQGLHRA